MNTYRHVVIAMLSILICTSVFGAEVSRVETDTYTLKFGGKVVKDQNGNEIKPETWDECMALRRAKEIEQSTRTISSSTFECMRSGKAVVKWGRSPPTCTTPRPEDGFREQQCPTGTVGIWTQTHSWTQAAYPDCSWSATPWTPEVAPPGMCAVPNNPPTISGAPATSVVAGQSYSFTPVAVDADGDSLTFTIASRPTWATFNASTGRLSGTPAVANVGNFSNIRIGVSDGEASATLPAFTITVTQPASRSIRVSWTAPTHNTNDTPLTNLAGYRIHYGRSATALSETLQLSNAGLTSYLIENLAPGTWFFAVSAYSTAGVQSEMSNIASKVVP